LKKGISTANNLLHWGIFEIVISRHLYITKQKEPIHVGNETRKHKWWWWMHSG